MRRFLLAALLGAMAQAEVVDRIAVIVGNRVVKDSDIDVDIRITAFLNRQRPAFTAAARRESAQRLIDQIFIRDEMTSGDYESAPVSEAQNLLADLKKTRFGTEAAYRAALESYAISEEDLKAHLVWQTTVLHFIELRFRPAVLVTEDDIAQYFEQHKQPGETLEQAHDRIEDTIAEQRVNRTLFDWLARRRAEAKIVYLEAALK
ncbi:MAG TPA: hypothetical protein VKS01_00335 [Bryobacteraceae bacterium]|nr:hypothetical protein [Bryobacteraceae bacterium]